MARDGAGIDVHLDRVPLREAEMEPWEIMISESQERMVAVVRPQMLAAVERVCAKWELPCTVIGEVTDSALVRAVYLGDVVGEIPAAFLTDECPRYELDSMRRPPGVLASPQAQPADHSWIYEQYDHLVGSRTIRRPGFDAAVLRLRPSRRGIAVSLQGPPPGELELAAEAALVRYVWKAAPVLTLAHDVSNGGLEAAVAEAAGHSRIEAKVELPEPALGGQVLLACAPQDVERLGTKGIQRIGVV